MKIRIKTTFNNGPGNLFINVAAGGVMHQYAYLASESKEIELPGSEFILNLEGRSSSGGTRVELIVEGGSSRPPYVLNFAPGIPIVKSIKISNGIISENGKEMGLSNEES